jgi:hypothetical protein
MSYRRSYTGYVHYSGSVSYPASESGGSVSYSGSEPVYITIDVDTDDFDASVGHCNGAIHGLQAAVVATEAAQVAAKVEASRKVSDSVIKGFFNYVGADLAQKIKELSSITESKFIEMMDQKSSCLSKTEQMQTDYLRITKRYSKLFDDLDREMVSRVELLDRPAFQFEDASNRVANRKADSELLGLATISANENIQLETVLSCSYIKKTAGEVLEKTNDYLKGVTRLASSIRDMLSDGAESAEIHLPAMFVESVQDAGVDSSRVYGLDNVPSADSLKANLMTGFRSDSLGWSSMGAEEREYIDSYINSYIQEDVADERLQKTILELVNGADVQTIK